MKFLTRKEIVAGVPKRWAELYRGWPDHGDRFDKRPIMDALNALEPGFTADQVNKVIGNTSWTECLCDECGRDVEAVAMLGGNREFVCADCLKSASLGLANVIDGRTRP